MTWTYSNREEDLRLRTKIRAKSFKYRARIRIVCNFIIFNAIAYKLIINF